MPPQSLELDKGCNFLLRVDLDLLCGRWLCNFLLRPYSVGLDLLRNRWLCNFLLRPLSGSWSFAQWMAWVKWWFSHNTNHVHIVCMCMYRTMWWFWGNDECVYLVCIVCKMVCFTRMCYHAHVDIQSMCVWLFTLIHQNTHTHTHVLTLFLTHTHTITHTYTHSY